MKTLQDRQHEIRRQRVEAIIEGRIGALFRRVPALCGFLVSEDLEPAQVTLHSWPGYVPGQDLDDDIVLTLAEILEQRPEAAELLRGRAFARVLH